LLIVDSYVVKFYVTKFGRSMFRSISTRRTQGL